MDPITTAIVAALSAGAISGITDTAKTAVNDGYNKLKSLLTKKHGAGSEVVQAINKLETKPESQGRVGRDHLLKTSAIQHVPSRAC